MIIETIIVLLASTVLAHSIAAESSLAYDFKKWLGLDDESLPTLERLSDYRFWKILWGYKLEYIMLIPNLMLVVFFKAYKYLNEMINCPYCLCVHTTWTSLYFIVGKDLLTSIALGLVTIITAKLYDHI